MRAGTALGSAGEACTTSPWSRRALMAATTDLLEQVDQRSMRWVQGVTKRKPWIRQ